VDDVEAAEFALQHGALAFLECSSRFPETVRRVLDEVLAAAKEYYGLQWQLRHDRVRPEPARRRHSVEDAREDVVEGAPWVRHERLNIVEDPRSLDEATASKNLSVLGVTPTNHHAYLRLDIPDLGLTSLDAVRRYQHLQFVNVSKNQLRSLEPLGALRCLLHLNASYNLLIRTQSFAASESLETVDMSYNMIGKLGEWGVHKFLRELNLRGNFIDKIGPGLRRNAELRMLDLSENNIPHIENLDGLGLRTLFLAQNELTSLEGVGTLPKLQVLSVRHNNITSIAALRSDDVPRLRKLFVSENRISRIQEVEGLQSFRFLCDLSLVPNPVTKLPHYRAQVIHRLPRLRSLDSEAVTAEEKVKADLIYGSDVEERREIFEQLLPEETFTDRRLVTEEGIAKMELEQFGRQGDAGQYGFTLSEQQEAVQQPDRTIMQDAKLRQRLMQARLGGQPAGVCELVSFAAPFASARVTDEDIPEVLEAVAEGCVTSLILGAAPISVGGVREILAFLREAPHLRHVDLTGCQAVGQIGTEIVHGFPFARGCSIEADKSGLSRQNVERLRNRTAEGKEALKQLEQERMRTQEMMERFMKLQEVLKEEAAENRHQDSPPPPPPHLCHPLKWRDGIEGPAQAALRGFRAANPRGLICADGPVSVDGGSRCWSIRCKDNSKREFNMDEHQALKLQRNSMFEEWGCEPVENWYDGVGEYEEGEDLTDRIKALLPGRPLPEAFLAAFNNVMQDDSFLGFMVWEGIEPSQEVVREVRRQREEWEAAWAQKQQRMGALSAAARKLYDLPMRSSGVESGQLVAHFTYLRLGGILSGKDSLRPSSDFGLKRFSEEPLRSPQGGHLLQEAVSSGKVTIESVTGTDFLLRLKLRNNTSDGLEVTIPRGTVFQHVDWEHRQNLMVSVRYVVGVPAGEVVSKQMKAYCMNLTCACSEGNPMALTDFYCDDAGVLVSQGLVWDHFERCFAAVCHGRLAVLALFAVGCFAVPA